MNETTEQTKLNYIRNKFGKYNKLDRPFSKYEIINYNFKDDCSYMKLPNNDTLVVSSDFIRGEYFNMFQEKYINYFDLGYFLVIANLSDLASSGAKPQGISLIIRYSNTISDIDFKNILSGIDIACKKYQLDIIGGDTGSYIESVLAATIMGIITKTSPMLRMNAQVGDSIYVSGQIGLAITSMVYFLHAKKLGLNLSVDEESILLKQWKEPEAFIDFGMLLLKHDLSSCCQDISDGLKASIEQISEASKVFMKIEKSKIPLSEITLKVANFLSIDPYKLAFSISADFNLLFTMKESKYEHLHYLDDNNMDYYHIGTVYEGNTNVFITENGTEEIPGIKWEHQSGDFIKEVVDNAKI